MKADCADSVIARQGDRIEGGLDLREVRRACSRVEYANPRDIDSAFSPRLPLLTTQFSLRP